jgi:hypothetical protein
MLRCGHGTQKSEIYKRWWEIRGSAAREGAIVSERPAFTRWKASRHKGSVARTFSIQPAVLGV